MLIIRTQASDGPGALWLTALQKLGLPSPFCIVMTASSLLLWKAALESRALCRTYRSWQDFFLGSAVLGQYGHSVALEMAGRPPLPLTPTIRCAQIACETSVLPTCRACHCHAGASPLHLACISSRHCSLSEVHADGADAMRNAGGFQLAYTGGW